MAGALSLFAPASAQARTTLWSGTLTVGTANNEAGCGSQSGGACSGRLTTDTVTLEGKAYLITEIVVRNWKSPPDLKLKLTRKFPDDFTLDNPHGRIWKRLTLQVGGKSFDAYDAPNLNDIGAFQSALEWDNAGLSWTSGQQVQARLFYNDQPSVPRNVRAIAGDNRITLNWDAPSSWGDGTAGGFQIEWKPTDLPPDNWTPVNGGAREYEVGASVSSFVLSGTQRLEGRSNRVIDTRNSYDLRVRAFSANPKATGDWVEVTSSPLTLVPGDGRLTASWTTPGDTYQLQYKESDAPDRASVTGGDPALGWVYHEHRLGNHRYVLDFRGKSAVIRGVYENDNPKGLQPGTSYDVRLRAKTGGTAGQWSAVARATTLGTKPAAETTTEPTRSPSRRVELLKEQTLLTATLTVDEGGGFVGCSNSDASLTNCSFPSFTLEGTTYTISDLYSYLTVSPNELRFHLGTTASQTIWRKLTLHIDDRSFPVADVSSSSGPDSNGQSWENPGFRWTDGQQVQVRLTAREWTGVEFSSAGFVPSDEWWVHDLLVPEGGSETFGIKLTKQPTANVTISLWKNTGPALVHGDVNAATVSPATLTFTSTNWSQAQTVTVTGVQDDDSDHEHLWIRAVISSTDTDYSTPDFHESVFVTVTDSGGAAQVGAWPAIGREAGNGQASNVPVTVWLSRSVAASVSVSYRTADGTATAGSDYTAVNGTLTFAPGETRKTVNIPILDDNVEDSGDTFYLVLSNPAGASLEPSYTRAGIQILNDEAHLDGLSIEGAGSAGGPWAKLDLGAFAAETTAYAVTVPHGTTHARLVPASADEDLTLRAGSGTALTRVRSGESGRAVALAVGANVLVVKTTAGTGVEKTYEVTVTREAAQQQAEAEQPEAQQQALDPLTARLRGAVSEHDGETPFMLELVLSESLEPGSRWPSAASLAVKGGSVESVRRFRPYLYQFHVKPKSWKDVTVTLAGGRACSEEGAICTADGRSVSNTSSTTIGGPVRIRIEGARAKEGKDESLDFAVTLNRAAGHEISVDYATEDDTATAGADYTATSGTLTFAAGETAKTVAVPVLDDAIDEGKETMRLKLSNPKGAYLRNVHRQAKGVIRNDDTLQQAWLARFGRMVASDAVGAVTARLETPRDAGSHVTFAGQRMNFGEAEGGGGAALATVLTGLAQTFGAPGAPAADEDDPFVRLGLTDPWNDPASSTARSMTGRELLLGTSFRAVLGQGAGSQWTSWGQGASVSQFSAAAAGLDLSGESATGSMGMDYEHGRLLTGFAMTHSVGEGTAQDEGWRYALGSTATMAMPYARLALTDRISAWGLAGTGSGTLSLDLDGAVPQRYRTDLSMTLAAAGVRGDLVKPVEAGGFALALKADAFWVRTESEGVSASRFGNLAAARGESSRVRAVLDGSRTFALSGGAALTPSVELGLRHDGGDAETGTGVEFGTGLGYADPSRGLDMALKVHGLAVHDEDGYDEWGVSGQLRLVPGHAGRGLSASFTPSYGVDPGGTERLWALPDAHALSGNEDAAPSNRLDTEFGYGLPVFGGGFTGTPNVGFGMSEAARDYRIGWRLTPAAASASGFEVNLDAVRREPANGNEVDNAVVLRGAIAW